jgi:hypothetical protein
MQPEIFLGSGMDELKNLISKTFPGAVLEFSWLNGYDGGNTTGMQFRDFAGNRFDALGSFTVVTDGEKKAVAQLFLNMKAI